MPATFPMELRSRFRELVRRACGFDLSDSRENALMTAIRKRMTARSLHAGEAYYQLLNSDREELHTLILLLTVNETYFFREPEHLKLIVETLIPELRAARPHGTINILSAGCSTGEEAYSVAMLLYERYGPDCGHQFTITGIDIDSKAIRAAQNGVYSKFSFRGTPPVQPERYFSPDSSGCSRINDTIRPLVQFRTANLLTPRQSLGTLRPDIILYRNVSIYFPPDIQREIFSQLAGLLGNGGFLIVGASETLHHDLGILTLLERNGLFFYGTAPRPAIGDRRSGRRHPAARSPEPAPVPRQAAPPSPTPAPPVAVRSTAAPSPPAAGDLDARACFDVALEQARSGRTDEALASLDLLLAHDRSFVKAQALKACLLLNEARHDEARLVGEIMIDIDPFRWEAYLILGIIARHQGKGDEAFKRFREALYLDAGCWLAHFYTAEILFSRKEYKRARSSYETTVVILTGGSLTELGQAYFPLSYNAEQFITICRHKLALLSEFGS